jgi:hypothetical protein
MLNTNLYKTIALFLINLFINLFITYKKMESKTTLEIIIENATFAREFNYFITVQLDGYDEKVINY